ncbi:MAG TPA: TIGR03960 family B12-binding radical SAM protein, partial [Coriobacteriia bacterium]|nr:TIGR03960 family B12-binding radical SAM protein [Coriobacteriia bacterium]
VGMSHLGSRILYDILNNRADAYCERAYMPWGDMREAMERENVPLFSLETKTPLSEFGIVGFSLTQEMCYTSVLAMLALSNIELWSEKRDSGPFILAGGPCTSNLEPVAPFFDLAVLGDGEDVIGEIADAFIEWKQSGEERAAFLRRACRIPGVYAPGFYRPVYSVDGAFLGMEAEPFAPEKIRKRAIASLENAPFPEKPLVPGLSIVHDRAVLELFRGCTRGCRFCQAGMIYRPVRERSADTIVDTVARGLACTGFDEVSLVSLSSTDHSQIEPILKRLNHMLSGTGVGISLPSQRLDAFGVDMALLVAGEKKTGLTFAPEAGTQRLRDIINKNVTEENLIDAVEQAYAAGWRRCKLYFMIGLPGETDEDVIGIAKLANRAYNAAKDSVPDAQRGNVRMTASVAVFVPKPHTPFQWSGQINRNEVQRRIDLLRSSGLHKGVDLSWHDPATSRLEAALSRTGREGAPLIEAAWRAGALFDAWSERFDESLWEQAAAEVGLDIASMAERDYALDDPLPWDHIGSGITKRFLAKEYAMSQTGESTGDCSFDKCLACGVCTDLDVGIALSGESRA